MEKKKMSFNVGRLKFEEEKNQFTGYVNGDYCVMKQAQSGEWFLQAWRDVTFFEPRQNENKQDLY